MEPHFDNFLKPVSAWLHKVPTLEMVGGNNPNGFFSSTTGVTRQDGSGGPSPHGGAPLKGAISPTDGVPASEKSEEQLGAAGVDHL